MASKKGEPGVDLSSTVSVNGVAVAASHVQGLSQSGALGLTRELLQSMQQDGDAALPESLTEEPDVVSLGRPGRSFFTVHPDDAFSLRWHFAIDPLRSDGANDPYLVLPSAAPYFDPHDLSLRWLMACLRFEDEIVKPFLWAPSWYELGSEPADRASRARRVGRRTEASKFHQSVDRVVRMAKVGWGQALYRGQDVGYVWRPWPVELGEQPGVLWPDQDFFDILTRTFQDRIIADGSHPVVRALSGKVVTP